MASQCSRASRLLLLLSSSLPALAVCGALSVRAQNLDQITKLDAGAPSSSPAVAGTPPDHDASNVDAGIRHNKDSPFDTPPVDTQSVASMPAATPAAGEPPPSVIPAPPAVAPAAAKPPENPPAPPIDTAATTPAPPAPIPVVLAHPDVVDSAKFTANGQTEQLFGVVGLPGDEAKGLKAYIVKAGDQLTCQTKGANESVCLLPDGEDIAMVGLVNGVAQARVDAPDAYRAQENAAQGG